MKQLLFIVSFLCITLNSWSMDEKFAVGNKLYADSKFDEAILTYEEIIKKGVESKDLYFNLGNAYYKSGNLPKAIINYERSLRIDPNDDDVKYNLELANSQKIDKIEILGQFFLKNWINNIISKGSSDFWAITGNISFIILLILSSLFLFTRSSFVKKISFYIGITSIIIVITSLSFSYNQKQKFISQSEAIVFSPSVTAKSSPDQSGTELFVIHEGTKVKILETLGTWQKIQLTDGSQGWLPSVALEKI
ncbi:MAG: tetratricopeptide repeat protein [Marinilabiliaceae bacterium]|nr:tetratricopeptide repeat protein [Marinilabiliaceae bacterium]